ncbi:MAG TPA: hypothetical protein VJ001_05790 [Rhodocyclaceae bacterium]|nr:hypothetical protein [Rhodocyclaceae bacterium]
MLNRETFEFSESVGLAAARKSIKPRKSSCPQMTQIFADKTTTQLGSATHLLGGAAKMRNSMKICANLRNLRIELKTQ